MFTWPDFEEYIYRHTPPLRPRADLPKLLRIQIHVNVQNYNTLLFLAQVASESVQ